MLRDRIRFIISGSNPRPRANRYILFRRWYSSSSVNVRVLAVISEANVCSYSVVSICSRASRMYDAGILFCWRAYEIFIFPHRLKRSLSRAKRQAKRWSSINFSAVSRPMIISRSGGAMPHTDSFPSISVEQYSLFEHKAAARCNASCGDNVFILYGNNRAVTILSFPDRSWMISVFLYPFCRKRETV